MPQQELSKKDLDFEKLVQMDDENINKLNPDQVWNERDDEIVGLASKAERVDGPFDK